MKHKNSITTATLPALALPGNLSPKNDNRNVMASEKKINQPLLSPLHSSRRKRRGFWGPGGDKYEFLVTGIQSAGTAFILHADVPAGGPPPHIHNNESESYYIEEGELVFLLGEKSINLNAGDFVHIPEGSVHTFTNKGTGTAKMLTMFAPSGMEGWFEEVLVPVKDKNEKAVIYTKKQLDFMIEAGPRHGVTWRLPPDIEE